MDRDKIIALLNQDLEGEHAAVIQYLVHAYAMGEGEMACEIEAIAREEMRHFDWLAETIVSLGGTPSLERGDMRTGGEAVPDWMKNDVLQEKDAITLYEEHIEAIGDPKIKRLLERILSDEKSHRGDFEHFVNKAQKEGARDLRGSRQDKVTQALNWGIEHEYTVILQYLLHSYMAPNEDVKKEMDDQAINEMQHLGWLSEKMVGKKGSPRIEHTEVDKSTRTADMLRADIKIEKKVAAEYDRAAKEIEEPDLKELLIRIRDHELYHVDVFDDLLKEEEGRGK
ncbi:MAG: ferritin-like domain-containing protein, partial [Candidatus Aminicenantes bacterium]|nr:ferritin-like domain-containing protein [Candidatus Aminicenantes bacterium]